MKPQEKIKDIIEFFKDFELTVISDTEEVKIYEYRNPKNSNLLQRWIINRSTLIVVGDAYDSIYRSGAFTNLESIASCNIHYFSSKCVADKDGRDQSVFDNEKATEFIHSRIIRHWADELDPEEAWDTWAQESILETIEEHVRKKENDHYLDIPRGFDDEYDTVIWLREDGKTWMGADWWDGINLNKKTNVPYWHLAAIKSAVSKMKLYQ